MQQSQLLKGVLEGCVLAIIARKPVYGYELMQQLKADGFTTLVGGTLYPLLGKLEKNGDLRSEMQPSPEGPDRKYFTLTDKGAVSLKTFTTQWQTLTTQVAQILEEQQNEGYN